MKCMYCIFWVIAELLVCCSQAKDEYDIVANSWRYGTTFVDFQMYFAFVDFDEAPDVFSYVCASFCCMLDIFTFNSSESQTSHITCMRCAHMPYGKFSC